jgi:hypothetical protein
LLFSGQAETTDLLTVCPEARAQFPSGCETDPPR